MELNNRASLDIMGFSLCLDDPSCPVPTTNINNDNNNNNNNNKSLINNNNLSSLNTNSFYIANEDDAVASLDEEYLFSNRYKPSNFIQQRNYLINNSNLSNDNSANISNLENNLKKLYLTSSNVPINNSLTSNVNQSIVNNSSNSNLTELDNVKHKLSSFWNNVKYGKKFFFAF